MPINYNMTCYFAINLVLCTHRDIIRIHANHSADELAVGRYRLVVELYCSSMAARWSYIWKQ